MAIGICLLGLAKSLDSGQLIGTTTGMIWFQLTLETWGMTSWDEPFWHTEARQYEAKPKTKRKQPVHITRFEGDKEGDGGEKSEVTTLAGSTEDSVPAFWCG